MLVVILCVTKFETFKCRSLAKPERCTESVADHEVLTRCHIIQKFSFQFRGFGGGLGSGGLFFSPDFFRISLKFRLFRFSFLTWNDSENRCDTDKRTALDKKDHIIYFMSTILPIPVDDTVAFDLGNRLQLQTFIVQRSVYHHFHHNLSTMGKGGEKSVAPVEGVLEVLIDGRFYDVSKMKHPGGSVIKFYAGKGIDATQAFDNFHIRSKKAKKILDHLPSRIADKKETEQNLLPGQASLLEDFNQLTRDCKYRSCSLDLQYILCES